MPKHKIVLLATLATVIVTFVVLYFLGNLLLVLGLSGVIAYVLLPVVKLIERGIPWRDRRPGLVRTVIVALVFLAAVGVIAGVLFLIVPPTIRQINEFVDEFPQLFRNARLAVEGWITLYSERVPEQLRQQIEEALANAGNIVLQAVQNMVSQTVMIITTSFSVILALAIAPMLIFYLVKDSGAIRSGLVQPFPFAMKPHIGNILDIAHRTVGGYIRGQLTLGLVVGTIVAVGLMLLGVPFAFLLGIVAGITELIPFIGPWIGGAVGVLVTLATAPELIWWVILLYVGVQLLENSVLVPRIQGHTLNLHPVVVLLVITVASQLWGIWGVILGPPVAAFIKDLIVYFVQQWNLDSQSLPAEITSVVSEVSASARAETEGAPEAERTPQDSTSGEGPIER